MIPAANPPPNRSNLFWILSGICFLIFIIALAIDTSNDDQLEGNYIEAGEDYKCVNGEIIDSSWVNDGDEDCRDGTDESESSTAAEAMIGSFSCCFSIIFGIIAISVRRKQQKIIIIQQQPQFVPVVQQVVQPVQRVAPRPAPQPAQRIAAPQPAASAANLAANAKNLERARDFEAAAKMYQKAGMYEDAGRVRQAHLEKEEQAVVQIGQVGNTVLNDSVMINDGAPAGPKTCWACQSAVEETWAVCPNCEASL